MGRPARVILLAALALCAILAPGPDAEDFSGTGTDLRTIATPIRLGTERIAERLDAVRAEGREPLALVLSGGSARAYAHIGVLRVLENAGIVPDLIVANSMGAIIGLYYAAGFSPDDIERMVTAMPAESFFEPVLPTHGGILNADRFAGFTRSLTGNLDLKDLDIPVIITAEDLQSRRHVDFSEGAMDEVIVAAFALPVIFEPKRMDGMILVDGGIVNLVPAGLAAEFTDAVLVSATLYDRALNYSNPVTVLNRSFDIGKTRQALEDLYAVGPPMIRNDVEQLSFMSFASARPIIERGERSADEALPGILDRLPPHWRGGGLRPETIALRAERSARLDRVLEETRRGVVADTSPNLRFKVAFRVLDEVGGSATGLDGMRFMGLGARFAAGRSELSVLAGAGLGVGLRGSLGAVADEEWLVMGRLKTVPVDALSVEAETHLSGAFDAAGLPSVPETVGAGAAVSWLSAGAGLPGRLVAEPRISGIARYRLPTANLDWRARGSLGLRYIARGADAAKPSAASGQPSAASTTTAAARAAGPAAASAARAPRLELALAPGAFAEASGAAGPEAALSANLTLGGVVRLSARGTARLDLAGPGSAAWPQDAFRGIAPAGKTAFRAAAGTELVWTARALGFGIAETFLIRDLEFGAFADIAWARAASWPTSPAQAMPEAGAAGILVTGIWSLIGLSPLEWTAYAGLAFDGSPVAGFGLGRLFRQGAAGAP